MSLLAHFHFTCLNRRFLHAQLFLVRSHRITGLVLPTCAAGRTLFSYGAFLADVISAILSQDPRRIITTCACLDRDKRATSFDLSLVVLGLFSRKTHSNQ